MYQHTSQKNNLSTHTQWVWNEQHIRKRKTCCTLTRKYINTLTLSFAFSLTALPPSLPRACLFSLSCALSLSRFLSHTQHTSKHAVFFCRASPHPPPPPTYTFPMYLNIRMQVSVPALGTFLLQKYSATWREWRRVRQTLARRWWVYILKSQLAAKLNICNKLTFEIFRKSTPRMDSIIQTLWKLSGVRSIVIVYSQFCSELTFQKFYQPPPWMDSIVHTVQFLYAAVARGFFLEYMFASICLCRCVFISVCVSTQCLLQ